MISRAPPLESRSDILRHAWWQEQTLIVFLQQVPPGNAAVTYLRTTPLTAEDLDHATVDIVWKIIRVRGDGFQRRRMLTRGDAVPLFPASQGG